MCTIAAAVQQLKEYNCKKLVSSTEEVCLLIFPGPIKFVRGAELETDGKNV